MLLSSKFNIQKTIIVIPKLNKGRLEIFEEIPCISLSTC